MSMFISSLMFVALLAVSVAHLVWTFGSTWPIRDERLLAQTVIGYKDARHVPRGTAFGVFALTLLAGIMAVALADETSGGIWLSGIGLALAVVFLARGILGYTSAWAERRPEPSFRFNDRRVYSPLCLAVGVGFLALVALRLI